MVEELKIVIAPDSFKGSLSAPRLCQAMAKGIKKVYPNAEIIKIPLADGGEGTMENMVYSSGGLRKGLTVKGPIGKSVVAQYGVLGDKKTVVIEMAQASGLTLLSEDEKDPMNATSYGTGDLICDALDQGYRKFIIGLGGSATNDAGVGMLKALGVKFLDKNGEYLHEGGGNLIHLAKIDDKELDPRIRESTFLVASDVTNTLCGPKGASAVFGPQKGASPTMVKDLDKSLNHLADIVLDEKGVDMREQVGGGAAGGMGSALITFLNAKLESGIDVIMESINFEQAIKGANLIITGEGKLDQQTMQGKVINGVCKVAKKHQIPVIALCGSLELHPSKFDELGLLTAFSIVPSPCSLTVALDKAEEWTINCTEQMIRLLKLKSNN